MSQHIKLCGKVVFKIGSKACFTNDNKSKLVKCRGIYAIRCPKANAVYVGKSSNITYRWFAHMSLLLQKRHHNKNLQEYFDKYGITKLSFEILQVVDASEDIDAAEQYWIDVYKDATMNINKNCVINTPTDATRFINYINSKWLLPKGVDVANYRIWKQEDKDEIVQMAVRCKLFTLTPREITFIKVMKLLQNCLGYEVEDGRVNIEGERRTYKLVVSFEESGITYTPAYKTVHEGSI